MNIVSETHKSNIVVIIQSNIAIEVKQKMKIFNKALIISQLVVATLAFTLPGGLQQTHGLKVNSLHLISKIQPSRTHTSPNELKATPDYEVVALVAGQENYGFAIVALGEAIWSFSQAPSMSHAKVLLPASIAAVILVAVSGPLVSNASDPAAQALGLEIATAVSLGLGASYIARLLAPFSPSAKEIAFLGLLVAIAGFFSFSQNLVVDGFISLPSLPSIPLPSLPTITLPFVN